MSLRGRKLEGLGPRTSSVIFAFSVLGDTRVKDGLFSDTFRMGHGRPGFIHFCWGPTGLNEEPEAKIDEIERPVWDIIRAKVKEDTIVHEGWQGKRKVWLLDIS